MKAYSLYIKNETVIKCPKYTNKNLKSLEYSFEELFLKLFVFKVVYILHANTPSKNI